MRSEPLFFRRYRFRWSLILAVILILGGLFFYTARGIRIETDISEWDQVTISEVTIWLFISR
jgi:hypothetical protein